jgi:hypothetical protein
MDPDPITAMRAVIRVESAEVVDSKYKDAKERPQKQFACELSVVSGAGDRDGEIFREWFSFPATGKISPGTKTGQVLSATLGNDRKADTLEELADRMEGKTFSAQIGASRDGEYPRVVHDTIGKAETGSPEPEPGDDLPDFGGYSPDEEEPPL